MWLSCLKRLLCRNKSCRSLRMRRWYVAPFVLRSAYVARSFRGQYTRILRLTWRLSSAFSMSMISASLYILWRSPWDNFCLGDRRQNCRLHIIVKGVCSVVFARSYMQFLCLVSRSSIGWSHLVRSSDFMSGSSMPRQGFQLHR